MRGGSVLTDFMRSSTSPDEEATKDPMARIALATSLRSNANVQVAPWGHPKAPWHGWLNSGLRPCSYDVGQFWGLRDGLGVCDYRLEATCGRGEEAHHTRNET